MARDPIVIEIFGPTIQGEGPLVGTKTGFVRFGGCDFRCEQCDSLHAVLPQLVKKHGQKVSQQEIVSRSLEMWESTGTPWVTFSGGNPAMWDLAECVSRFHLAGVAVAVETQGTLYKPWLSLCQMVVVSPKTPSMGEKFEPEVFKSFLQKLGTPAKFGTQVAPVPPVALKVVVFNKSDLDFALQIAEVAKETTLFKRPEGEVMFFLSLGNPYPSREGVQELSTGALRGHLLDSYTELLEAFTTNKAFKHWKFLPQLHVLAYGNIQGV